MLSNSVNKIKSKTIKQSIHRHLPTRKMYNTRTYFTLRVVGYITSQSHNNNYITITI